MDKNTKDYTVKNFNQFVNEQKTNLDVTKKSKKDNDINIMIKALDAIPDYLKDELTISKDYPTIIKKTFNKYSELIWISDGKESFSPKSKEGKRLQALLLDPLTHNAPKDAKYIHLHDRQVQSTTTFRLKEATSKGISNAYHKAKLDGSNPELVKAVETMISKELD